MSNTNYLKKELIGLPIEILEAKNKSLVGIKGIIIDETKNTITIKNHSIKKIIKNQVILKIKFDKKIIKIDGKLLLNKPEERIKKWKIKQDLN